MIYGLWLSADGLSSQQVRQEVIANNLTQVDTPGFKPDRVAFGERLNEYLLDSNPSTRLASYENATGGLLPAEVFTDFTQGSIVPTGNDLDTALLDEGFFAIQTADGTRYSRDGRFTLRTDGGLEHIASGGKVLDAAGNAITIDPNVAVAITQEGRIQQNNVDVARLGVFRFENPQQLQKIGENLYEAPAGGAVLTNASVRQKAIEASGSDPASMLVDMMTAARAYELSASMIQMQDESLGRLVNDVGRIA